MKTKLPAHITTVQRSIYFLTELHNNSEAYHPEDDATDIIWNMPDDQLPTQAECEQLNVLMSDIYALPGNESVQSMVFDPCELLLKLSGHIMED